MHNETPLLNDHIFPIPWHFIIIIEVSLYFWLILLIIYIFAF